MAAPLVKGRLAEAPPASSDGEEPAPIATDPLAHPRLADRLEALVDRSVERALRKREVD